MPNSTSNSSRRMILGVGNDILMDDGIGPRIVNNMKEEFGEGSLTTFQTINLGGLEIIEFIRNSDEVVIIDAIKTRGGIPGDIYILTPEDFMETCHLSSFHDVSFLTALKLANRLELDMPSGILIIAVEIIEDMIFGEELSPGLQERYDDIYTEIKGYLEPFIYGRESLSKIINCFVEYEN